MTTDLAAWLLEQIAEDETAIRERSFDRPIHFGGCYYYDNTLDAGRYCDCDEDGEASSFFLAECEAKRLAVIKLASAHHASTVWLTRDRSTILRITNEALRALALPYADREGYREEWRP